MSMRAWIAIGATVALVVGLVGSASAGDDDKHPSEVVITEYHFNADGDLIVKDLVASQRKECIKDRKVKLRFKNAQGHVANEPVGKDTTDEKGRSRIVVKNPKKGTYFETLEATDDCDSGHSQEIDVEPPR